MVVSDPKKLSKHTRQPLFKSFSFLRTETGEGFHEVIKKQRTVIDSKPVHLGLAILQHSKLLLLRYVDFLRTYLEEGSYTLVYGGMFYACLIFFLIII